MKKILFASILILFVAIVVFCGSLTVKGESSTMSNTSSNSQSMIDVVESNVLESDGIIDPLDQNGLVTKLAALKADMSLDEIIDIFGKEPFMVKESGTQIFKYYSGDITISLWGTRLSQVQLEYNDAVLYIDLQ